MTASFLILSNLLFTDNPTIRSRRVSGTVSLNKPKLNKMSMWKVVKLPRSKSVHTSTCKSLCTSFIQWHMEVHIWSFSQPQNIFTTPTYWSLDSSVGTATGYGLEDRGVGVRVPEGSKVYLLHVVQAGSGVHPTSYPMSTWVFRRGQSGRGVKLTTHLQLMPTSRQCGSTHPLPHTPSWRSA
jgi:hypothetical protein